MRFSKFNFDGHTEIYFKSFVTRVVAQLKTSLFYPRSAYKSPTSQNYLAHTRRQCPRINVFSIQITETFHVIYRFGSALLLSLQFLDMTATDGGT